MCPRIQLLVDMANDFVERVVTFSCQLAKHRGSDVLEVKDVQLHLGESRSCTPHGSFEVWVCIAGTHCCGGGNQQSGTGTSESRDTRARMPGWQSPPSRPRATSNGWARFKKIQLPSGEKWTTVDSTAQSRSSRRTMHSPLHFIHDRRATGNRRIALAEPAV